MGIIIAIPQMGTDLFRKYMKSKYVKSLERAGAQVKWIELENTESAIKQTMECDGLLLPGGADIEPALYGRERIEKCGKPNELRDKNEFAIYREFVKTEKPMLCICRGFQLLNVAQSGTLHQDISDIQKCKHSDFLGRGKAVHQVEIKEDTVLYGIFSSKQVGVNSMHHQATENVGEGLKISAVSADGFVEGLELQGHPFCVAVQWHPEHMSKKDPLQQKLFDEFVKVCKTIQKKQ